MLHIEKAIQSAVYTEKRIQYNDTSIQPAMREKFLAGDITQEEYDEWRYTYPKAEAEHFKQELDELRAKKKKSK